jgi:CRP-like cAMP-binding protein
LPGTFITTLTAKLRSLTELDAEDLQVIESVAVHGKLVPADYRIVGENEKSSQCVVILNGFVYGSKSTPLGRRQILSLHIPGDMPDLQGYHLKTMDHDLTTLTECTLGLIAHESVGRLIERPRIAAGLWRETGIQAAISREWTLNVGQREAIARVAHLLLEINHRLTAAGRAKDGIFDLPLTQGDLADCVGISSVHLNRVLQQLRREKLVSTTRSTYRLLDKKRLEELGQFNTNYLY